MLMSTIWYIFYQAELAMRLYMSNMIHIVTCRVCNAPVHVLSQTDTFWLCRSVCKTLEMTTPFHIRLNYRYKMKCIKHDKPCEWTDLQILLSSISTIQGCTRIYVKNVISVLAIIAVSCQLFTFWRYTCWMFIYFCNCLLFFLFLF